jgi:hypothetical protein
MFLIGDASDMLFHTFHLVPLHTEIPTSISKATQEFHVQILRLKA